MDERLRSRLERSRSCGRRRQGRPPGLRLRHKLAQLAQQPPLQPSRPGKKCVHALGDCNAADSRFLQSGAGT